MLERDKVHTHVDLSMCVCFMYITLIINSNLHVHVTIYLTLFHFGHKKRIVEMESSTGIVGHNILGFFLYQIKKI